MVSPAGLSKSDLFNLLRVILHSCKRLVRLNFAQPLGKERSPSAKCVKFLGDPFMGHTPGLSYVTHPNET